METRAQLGAVPRTAIVLAVLGLLLALVGSALVAGSAGESQRANGRIAFATMGDIYSTEPDGSDRQVLVEGAGNVKGLSWSPDGTQLAYWSADGSIGPWRLVVVDAEGGNAVTVASDVLEVIGGLSIPEWSPDGERLTFTAKTVEAGRDPCAGRETSGVVGEFCSSRVFVAAADGSTGAVQVGDPDMDARTVAWSPDGSTLAFGGGDAGTGIGLYLMDPDGSNIRRIDKVSGNGWAFLRLAWSSDGRKIAATAGLETWDIWEFASDGSTETMVSDVPDVPMDQTFPAYAPDGTLAWGGGVSEDACCLVLLEEGGAQRTLAGFNGVDAWSPDGLLIATTTAAAPGDLVIIDRDGQVAATIEDVGTWASWQRRPA